MFPDFEFDLGDASDEENVLTDESYQLILIRLEL